MLAKRDMITGVLVATLSFSVFLLSHVHQFADSNYSILLSQGLLHHGSFKLDGYKLPRHTPTQQIGYVSNGEIYQLEYIDANRLSFDHFWVAFAGNLISPSRGLLVFVPFILFIAYLLLRYARRVASTKLLWLCLLIIVAHLIVVAGFSPWWGGHCFGSRYTTGLVPWLALLGILAVSAWRLQESSRRSAADKQHAQYRRRWRIEAAIGVVLLLCSIFINARGAMASATWFWNIRPNNIDENPQRVWEWKNAQFLAR